MSLFGDDAHFTPVFARALRRLILGGLVFTTSCRRYQDERSFWPQVTDDSVFVAPAGRYYLLKLIGFTEYLWFMKDDIDWREAPPFSFATISDNTVRKAKGTLKALHTLMRLEYELLDGLRATVSIGMVKQRLYVDLFSAKRIPGSRNVLFTGYMQERFSDRLRRKFPDYLALFSEPLRDIHELHETFSRTREAFS
jgi:hypothetical protein